MEANRIPSYHISTLLDLTACFNLKTCWAGDLLLDFFLLGLRLLVGFGSLFVVNSSTSLHLGRGRLGHFWGLNVKCALYASPTS